MQRCLQLAKNGSGFVAPNPMVGAVLVYENKIIGEGWHKKYGEPHAEVNCLASVKESDKHLIENSTMYVSLEPCSHFGKTPPCSDLIIRHKIKKVVIGCVDSFAKVNGSGIDKLRNAGVEVVLGDWQNECNAFNKRFFTFHTKQRPYIILKWAQTATGKIAYENSDERLFISNEITNRLVHRWRSEEAAIMVGKNTALNDNPSLNNRLWHGKNPTRIVVDKNLELPNDLNIFNNEAHTIIFNQIKEEKHHHLHFCKIDFSENILQQIMQQCYSFGIQSILIEGGSKLLQSFIDVQLWDECRIINNEQLIINNGLDAPKLNNYAHFKTEYILNDRIDYYFINEI
ncbi:riboflavin biosynthesis protein RibD [Arachidicoccus ginsenosidimutans]|nr:riboflavin biosynthesis protein RibD [Arachidicoccus sp. BS20]